MKLSAAVSFLFVASAAAFSPASIGRVSVRHNSAFIIHHFLLLSSGLLLVVINWHFAIYVKRSSRELIRLSLYDARIIDYESYNL
jgi:hypothetical protein